MHKSESILEKEKDKILCDFYIKADPLISATRPGQVLKKKEKKKRKKRKEKKEKRKEKKEKEKRKGKRKRKKEKEKGKEKKKRKKKEKKKKRKTYCQVNFVISLPDQRLKI